MDQEVEVDQEGPKVDFKKKRWAEQMSSDSGKKETFVPDKEARRTAQTRAFLQETINKSMPRENNKISLDWKEF